jgi:hypothetical protein
LFARTSGGDSADEGGDEDEGEDADADAESVDVDVDVDMESVQRTPGGMGVATGESGKGGRTHGMYLKGRVRGGGTSDYTMASP